MCLEMYLKDFDLCSGYDLLDITAPQLHVLCAFLKISEILFVMTITRFQNGH